MASSASSVKSASEPERTAVATSGTGSRLWSTADGGNAHHLLDPATGESAWTGLVSATALAPTAVEAETLAKAALLSGPGGARQHLVEHAAWSCTTTARLSGSAPFVHSGARRPSTSRRACGSRCPA